MQPVAAPGGESSTTSQRELAPRESRAGSALEALRGHVYELDVASGEMLRDPGFADLIGMTEGEAVATRQWWRERIHPGDLERCEREREALIAAHGTTGRYEYRVRHRDGHWVWTSEHCRIHYDAAGQPTRIIGCTFDITESKRAELALRESEGRFRSLADALPLIVWVHDAEGKVTFVNRTYCELFGVTLEQVAGGGWQALLHTEDAPGYVGELMRCVRERVPYHAEARVRLPSGEWRWMESWGRPRLGECGEFLGFVGASADVNERRRVEQALREADRQKDEFLAMLAHELRNPLAPIRNAAMLLGRLAGSMPEAARPLAMLERQTQQLARLVDDLLDVSRITGNRIVLQREPLDLAGVVDQAVEMVQPLIARRKHHLRITRTQPRLYVDGDRARLVQCVSNLLSNAAKYTDREGELAVELRPAPGDAQRVEIEVRDNGRGIPAELLPRVFDLFVQSERTLDRSEGGLGVGLSVVRRLVEMHGGDVRAESGGQDRGARFIVRLPRIPAPRPVGADPGAGDADGPARRRILVVDDNVDAADAIAMLLRLDGHEVHTVYGALAALETAARLAPDTVLLDIGLPQLDGYEVARRLREQANGRELRLVALTGYGQPDDRERALAAGFDEHVVKPADLEALRAVLASHPAGPSGMPPGTQARPAPQGHGAARA